MSNVPNWTLPIAADQPCYFRHTFLLNLLSYLQKNGSTEVLPGDLRVSVAAQGETTVLVSAYIPAKFAFVPVKNGLVEVVSDDFGGLVAARSGAG